MSSQQNDSKRIVYADNNATTQVAPEVYEAMVPFLTSDYFNPSSMYEPAQHTKTVLEQSRARIAEQLGAGDPQEILFTSGATESNNTAIRGVAKANPNRRHIITTSVEHPAVWEVCQDLEREDFTVEYLPVDSDGNLDIGDFVRALRPDTLLVTIMHANNETGVIFPVAELARIVKETNPHIIFHTDATQSIGKMRVNLANEYRHVDLLSFSGHKLHAPKGIGALYARRGTRYRPLIIGGHQENGRRAGTENMPYIAGLAKAVELAGQHLEEEQRNVRALRDRLESELISRISWTQVNGAAAPRLPNTSNISAYYIEGEGMLFQLSAAGICASSGSACTSGSLEPSHVLRALKIPFTAIHGSVRFSLSRYNDDEDVDQIISVFPEIVTSLRRLSPYWDPASNAPRPDAEAMLNANS